MRLRKSESAEAVYIDKTAEPVTRDHLLSKVKGKSLSAGKKVLDGYRKTVVRDWLDRKGKPVVRSYGGVVMSVETKPSNADERRTRLLAKMREALDRGDILESQRLQLEYHELMEQIAD